ncbi:glycosyltransferase [bacterium]|nr:glycosyltransferase [bacterium]NIN92562.1 glycosyltransferase [bacterium]NIO18604.1 glycosyltransferase [bacterium]NIO73619.1 glycosyltransferase [bacterium]
MYREKRVAVVVPAYNEQELIGRVLETMPQWVDKVVVVDDASKDNTVEGVRKFEEALSGRLILLEHNKNQGVGKAIITGYKWARDNNIDVTAVMAGDAQMDPADLPQLLDPLVDGQADYTKGNRLITGGTWQMMPKTRYLGNAFISLLTKIVSGYWHVADFQCGYTATSLKVLKVINLDRVYGRFGMPNDFLVRLNVHYFRVKDVSVKAIYNIGEKSGVKIWKIAFTLTFLLSKMFFWRMKEKYIIRDFHPLVFFYLFGIPGTVGGTLFGFYMFFYRLFVGRVAATSVLFGALMIIAGLQFLLFAMWFDMEYNKDLK